MIKKVLFLFMVLAVGLLASHVLKDEPSAIFGKDLLINILDYDQKGSLHLGEWFTILQGKYFSIAYIAIALGVPLVFALHYAVIGPKIFAHDRKKIFVFSMFQRFIHWLAGVAFIVLIPTGLVMVNGTYFGGGEFVRICKELHAISTIFFAISVVPMTIFWFKEMLPIKADLEWLMILGGYLSKVKKPIPASKFNAGQKMWFWTCTFGGMILILTGAVMFFQDFDFAFIRDMGLSQIDLLRLSAIVHNVLGMVMVALFFTHIYMAVFAIKGAIHSMISGYKEEEEVEILHSIYYKKLKEENKI